MFLIRIILPLTFFLFLVRAQSTTRTLSPPVSTPAPSNVSLVTSLITVTTSSLVRGSNVPITTTIQTIYNTTLTPSPTSTSSVNSTASAVPEKISLATKIDPAFAVLGALLILTGLPSAFWGHKNRWTSFFLMGFYTLSLVCLTLILKFGILAAVNPPSKKLRGMFVLSCTIAGIGGGAIAIFFWKGAKFFIGAWGGFALGLWIQCFHNGGVIRPIGFRWILYMSCAVVGFILCTIPKIHYHILLVSTAFVGATATMLGIDCFTTAGLKEFYIWNLGFEALFPKFVNNGIKFPVSQVMQIELGLTAAIALAGIAVQLRVLKVLQRKLDEIAEEQKKRDEEANAFDSERFAETLKEREQWEKDHASSTDQKEDTLDDKTRPKSGLRDYLAPLTFAENPNPERPKSHPTGSLPALDLGADIEETVPKNYLAEGDSGKSRLSDAAQEDLKKRNSLLAEITAIRSSIEALKEPSSSGSSRHPSLGQDVNPSTLPNRRPRQDDPRGRVQSMDLDRAMAGSNIGRPTSAPLRDNDWDSYVQNRTLLQPPSGTTAPIKSKITMPAAVVEALEQRKSSELAIQAQAVRSSSNSPQTPDTRSSDDIPLSKLPVAEKANPSILPRQIAAPTPQRPAASAPRMRTYEELAERHREKMKTLQDPLTKTEKERADVEAAKRKWEKSKALEKADVSRRLSEKAAAFSKSVDRRKSKGGKTEDPESKGKHGRSFSADRELPMGRSMSSKRQSTLKVEQWQKYQEETKRHSAIPEAVPFPDSKKQHRWSDEPFRKVGQ